jgi:hypothetical protein
MGLGHSVVIVHALYTQPPRPYKRTHTRSWWRTGQKGGGGRPHIVVQQQPKISQDKRTQHTVKKVGDALKARMQCRVRGAPVLLNPALCDTRTRPRSPHPPTSASPLLCAAVPHTRTYMACMCTHAHAHARTQPRMYASTHTQSTHTHAHTNTRGVRTLTDKLTDIEHAGEHGDILGVVVHARARHLRLQPLNRDTEAIAQLGQAQPRRRLHMPALVSIVCDTKTATVRVWFVWACASACVCRYVDVHMPMFRRMPALG